MSIVQSLVSCITPLNYPANFVYEAIDSHNPSDWIQPGFIRDQYFKFIDKYGLYELLEADSFDFYRDMECAIEQHENEHFTYDSTKNLGDNLRLVVQEFIIHETEKELQPVIDAIRQFGLANEHMPKGGVLHAAKAWLKSQYLSPTPQWKDK